MNALFGDTSGYHTQSVDSDHVQKQRILCQRCGCVHRPKVNAFIDRNSQRVIFQAGFGEIVDHHGLGIKRLVQRSRRQNRPIQSRLHPRAVVFIPHKVDGHPGPNQHAHKAQQREYQHPAFFVTSKPANRFENRLLQSGIQAHYRPAHSHRYLFNFAFHVAHTNHRYITHLLYAGYGGTNGMSNFVSKGRLKTGKFSVTNVAKIWLRGQNGKHTVSECETAIVTFITIY